MHVGVQRQTYNVIVQILCPPQSISDLKQNVNYLQHLNLKSVHDFCVLYIRCWWPLSLTAQISSIFHSMLYFRTVSGPPDGFCSISGPSVRKRGGEYVLLPQGL